MAIAVARITLTGQSPENPQTPAKFLVENVDLLPKGRVLDIAMGTGRNAIYLAGLGFEVEGVDISPEAISIALASAERAGKS